MQLKIFCFSQIFHFKLRKADICNYIKCKLKKIISCLIGNTKNRVWLPFRYPVGISALNELNINDISHSKNWGGGTIDDKKQ